jgi:predicted nucleotidyltransferase/DNA-binding XRE family transcriptional regulator
MDTFGDIIRKLREEKGLPLRVVASYLDIDQAILSKMERGKLKPSRTHVVKIATYFKVNKNDLLVAWLSDLLVYEIGEEEVGLKALQVAEEKVAYAIHKNTDRKTKHNRVNKIIMKYFQSRSEISKAWLFGSFARGEDDLRSDIDVMIEVVPDSKFSLFDLSEIQHHLQNLLGRKIDIVMKGGVKKEVMERIKPDLKLIYER